MAIDKRKSITWGKRIVLVLLILGGLFYGMLSFAEKNPEPIRQGLEEYLTEAAGSPAQITTMTKVELVPYTAFGLKGVSLRAPDDPGKSLVTANAVYVSLPLKTLLFGAREYYALQAEKLEIAGGYFLPKKLALSYAGISDKTPEDGAANLVAEGNYNGQDFLLTAALERKRGKKFYSYKIGDASVFTFKIGTVEGDGVFNRKAGSFENITLVRGPHKAEFSMSHLFGKGPLTLDGKINGVAFTGVTEKTDGKTVLVITPVYAERDDDKRIENFVKVIGHDMGIDNAVGFAIKIAGIEEQKE